MFRRAGMAASVFFVSYTETHRGRLNLFQEQWFYMHGLDLTRLQAVERVMQKRKIEQQIKYDIRFRPTRCLNESCDFVVFIF